ncbi:MAG TPA: hypothetical protein VEY70_02920 [Metabacillus sp.]|nr:hypothetical protein [Metabacillus sp.]
MINEVTTTKTVRKVENLEKQNILDFIDGDGFDRILQYVLKGLFYGILFFCIPYFIFLMFSLSY